VQLFKTKQKERCSQGDYSEGKENNFLFISCVSVIKDRIPELYSLMTNGGLRQRLRAGVQQRAASQGGTG
jgi:hypothetical protein